MKLVRSFLSLGSLATFALGVLVFSLPAARVHASEDPAPALLSTINGVLDMTQGQSADAITAKLPQIRTKMDESFATDAIVQRAFGRNWTKLTPAQQKEAIDLLGKLIIRTYASALASGERPKVTILSSKEIGPDRREVTSTASQAGKTVNVVYRLAPVDGKWKVYDVMAENVSVVGNYRQQFDAHFQTKNAEDLLQTLRAKLSAPPEPAPAAGAGVPVTK
jgi:phospholipid transport system substrate-binding protein